MEDKSPYRKTLLNLSACLRKFLTAQLQPDKVSDSQILQEDSRGRCGLEVKGDIDAELGVQRGVVQGRRLLIEGHGVPQKPYE